MAAALWYLPYSVVVVGGLAEPGATLTFYTTGTTTKAPIYSTSGLTTELANPITANGAGRFADIYLDDTVTYRVIIKDALGTTLDDIDPYIPGVSSSTITLAAGSSVSTRTALANIASPVALQEASLTESGREGTFVFDDSDLSAEVTADTAQGVYVAPSTDTTGASGAWVRSFAGDVNPLWFGCAGDGVTSDHTALNAAAAVAAMLSRGLDLQGLTYIVESDTNYTPANGLYIPAMASGGPAIIRNGTVKRKAVSAGQMKSSARVMTLQLAEGQDYVLESLTVDGNEANVPYDSANPYEYEQAANIAFTGSATTIGTITMRDITLLGAVGDGIFLNIGITTAAPNVFIENVTSTRPRRTRSCIQIGTATNVFIRNVDVVNIESEPAAGSVLSDNNLLVIDGAVVHGSLDITGISTTNRWNIIGHGIKMLQDEVNSDQRFNLSNINGVLEDCDLKGTDMTVGASRFLAASLTIRGGTFSIPVNPSDATQAIPVRVLSQATTDVLKFVRTKFIAPSGITSVAGYSIPAGGGGGTVTLTGGYICPDYNSTTGTQRMEFIDCESDGNLPNVVIANRCGVVNIDGGKLVATSAIVRYVSDATYKTSLIIRRPERWSATAMIRFNTTTGNGSVSVSGSFDAELMAPVLDSTNAAGITPWSVNAVALVDSSPASRIRGFPGLTARLRVPAAGAADMWTYRNGSTPASNTTWDSELRGYGTNNIGYATGAGGTVTQATSKATGVTLNKLCGEITLNAAALAANTAVTFTLTNSTIAAGDRVIVNHVSGGTFGAYSCDGRSAAGSATMMVRNLTAGSLSEAIVLGFAVIKGVTA